MADKPGDPTAPSDSVEDPVAQKMAEIEKMRESLAADRDALAADRAQTTELNRTMGELAVSIRQQNEPEPEPLEPMPEEYDENTLRAAGMIAKRQLEAYHKELEPVLTSVQTGQFNSEWERVKAGDKKNFERMEKTMRTHFDNSPHLKVPGAVEELFVQMRGFHYAKLQELDRADRQGDTIVEPNPTTVTRRKDQPEKDTLTDAQWGAVKGLGVDPEHYYMAKHQRKPDFADGYLEDHGFKKEA